ncbi:IS200/IS605 family transposase [Salicibibacter halophilus]|uniref:IS200/IS605 family transposase n=1 Tax=Salicibibacter halophilus TaxID=2502791 RepID=A0A514LHB5_9BACI|nr:IS200/IS605 family transposase [Salicibibacter halophilus]QDI91240.1 IS200/IS605 family transposase [Salicibibacter halophilus]
MKFDSNNHSVFLMYDHLVLVVKYRRKVIDDAISDYARNKFVSLGERYNIALVEWNHDIDHIHILFKAQPNSEWSKFINVYKSSSSRVIKKDFSYVRKKLWKEMFWSRSFCLLTTGGSPIEMVKAYIENQGTKGGDLLWLN